MCAVRFKKSFLLSESHLLFFTLLLFILAWSYNLKKEFTFSNENHLIKTKKKGLWNCRDCILRHTSHSRQVSTVLERWWLFILCNERIVTATPQTFIFGPANLLSFIIRLLYYSNFRKLDIYISLLVNLSFIINMLRCYLLFIVSPIIIRHALSYKLEGKSGFPFECWFKSTLEKSDLS